MAIASGTDTLTRWRVEALLLRQPGLRIVPSSSDLVLAGTLEVNAQVSGRVAIRDTYEIELRIPPTFPRKIPVYSRQVGAFRALTTICKMDRCA